MSRFRIVYAVATLLALMMVGVGGLTGSAAATSIKPSASVPTPPTPKPFSSHFGFPAIKPHLNLAANTNEATFTAADIQQYVVQHGSPAGPLVPGAHLTFLKVLFVTAAQASVLMEGESTGLPDAARVCYVLIHGPFQFTPAHWDPKAPVPKIATEAEIVFDGRTGDLLVWGVPGGGFQS